MHKKISKCTKLNNTYLSRLLLARVRCWIQLRCDTASPPPGSPRRSLTTLDPSSYRQLEHADAKINKLQHILTCAITHTCTLISGGGALCFKHFGSNPQNWKILATFGLGHFGGYPQTLFFWATFHFSHSEDVLRVDLLATFSFRPLWRGFSLHPQSVAIATPSILSVWL